MGLKGMVTSAVAIVIGAILYWSLTAASSNTAINHGFRTSTIGVILMIAGAVGFLISTAVYISSRHKPAEPARTYDREAVDSAGHHTMIHEEQKNV